MNSPSRIAIVTGAGTGVGKAAALALDPAVRQFLLARMTQA